jgi:hypothetical protein
MPIKAFDDVVDRKCCQRSIQLNRFPVSVQYVVFCSIFNYGTPCFPVTRNENDRFSALPVTWEARSYVEYIFW